MKNASNLVVFVKMGLIMRIKLRKNFRALLQFLHKTFKKKKGKGSYERKVKFYKNLNGRYGE